MVLTNTTIINPLGGSAPRGLLVSFSAMYILVEAYVGQWLKLGERAGWVDC
jgi:hypothetical protein